MEQSSKNQDCYFYYYSTCTKGDSCHFRHEPSALGCEVMCTYWQQGNCMNEHCNFRHMELKKNRKSIPCYWESQRGGCKKPHCPFLHTLDRPAPSESTINPSKSAGPKPVTQEWSNRPDGAKFPETSGEGSVGHGSNESSSFISGSVVDPIIVNFNEETDNEGYTSSPQKSVRPPSPRSLLKFPKKKTYEEERIDEIVEETAAYYSYPVYGDQSFFNSAEDFLPCRQTLDKEQKNNMDFEILSLDEIKRRKRNQGSESSSIVDNLDSDATQSNTVTKPRTSNADSDLLIENLDRLPTEAASRKRKVESEDIKPIKLRRSGSAKKYEDNVASDYTVDKGDTEDKDIEMRLCDSTSDNKDNSKKAKDDFNTDNFIDDTGDCIEAFDDIVDDIDQLLQDKTS